MAETLEAKTEHATFPGGLWDLDHWELHLNEEVHVYDGDEQPCPHCVNKHDVEHPRSDGTSFTWTYWICPRVIVTFAEAGCTTTGTCADCVFEALKGLGHV
jgi:hypothetical protein